MNDSAPPASSESPAPALHGTRLGGDGDPKLLLTAAEGFPELERLFLAARDRITAGFRVFDPETRLRSDAARETGETWADLMVHVLEKGVRVELRIADFDPIHRAELHRNAHRSARQFREAAEAAGVSGRLELHCLKHPARSGLPARILFAPLEWRRLARFARRLNRLSDSERAAWLDEAPGIAALLTRGRKGKLRPRLDKLPPMVPGSHHQKLAVIDGCHLYIGGLDLDERRFDSPAHERAGQRTWHDVQLSLSGPVAAVAEAHLRAFHAECAGERKPEPRPGLLRTLSRARPPAAPFLGPKPMVGEIFDRHLQEIDRAEVLIYLETQFLRDRRLARALAARARAAPDLGLILVLPAAPEDVAFHGNRGLDARFGEYLQARCVSRLRRAFGARLAVLSPARPRGIPPDGSRAVFHGAPLIYVHSKVSVFDESCALVSSANLNGRSLRWDTEAGVALTDPGQIRRLRRRLMDHWLPEDAEPTLYDPQTAPAAWNALARQNAARAPGDRRGFLLPFPTREARRFGTPVPAAPEEMV